MPMVSNLQHPCILCGGKRAGPPKFLGEYEDKSMISLFLSHTDFKKKSGFLSQHVVKKC